MNQGVRRRLLSLGVWPALLGAADHVFGKLQLFSVALLHLLFSSDKSWLTSSSSSSSCTVPPDSTVLLMSPPTDHHQDLTSTVTKHKRILFIRHAESEWNVVFNRGLNLHALLNLLRAVVREWLLLPTGDSVFLDSPLSRRGRFQAQSLHDQLSQNSALYPPQQTEESALLRYLSYPLPNSVIATSNLRRTIDTARIASAARLGGAGEKIHVLSCLQEIGRNFDTLAISQPYMMQPHEVLVQAPHGEKRHDELFNVDESHGNKAVLGSGRDRLQTFVKWVFRQQKEVVVVYGHSLWFRAFFREFFPRDVDHEAKSAKMKNCGVVAFVLEEHSRGGGEAAQYNVQPESFQHLV